MSSPPKVAHDVRTAAARAHKVAELARQVAARLTDWTKFRSVHGG